jgi:hypothetical protein
MVALSPLNPPLLNGTFPSRVMHVPLGAAAHSSIVALLSGAKCLPLPVPKPVPETVTTWLPTK